MIAPVHGFSRLQDARKALTQTNRVLFHIQEARKLLKPALGSSLDERLSRVADEAQELLLDVRGRVLRLGGRRTW